MELVKQRILRDGRVKDEQIIGYRARGSGFGGVDMGAV